MIIEEYILEFEQSSSLDYKSLTLQKARSTYLAINKNEAFTLITMHSSNSETGYNEIIKVQIQTDIPQVPLHNILPTETLLIKFGEQDDRYPDVFCLRKDFPLVAHQNRTTPDSPRSPCIYEEPFVEGQLNWRGEDFLMRIQDWFAKTSRGLLHQPDQHLEPFFYPNTFELIVPTKLAIEDKESKEIFIGSRIERDNGQTISLFPVTEKQLADYRKNNSYPPFLVLQIKGNPKAHGIIFTPPNSMTDLDKYLKEFNITLLKTLQEFIRECYRSKPCKDDDLILILVELPKTRYIDSEVEEFEYWAFISNETIQSMGEKLNAVYVLDKKTIPIEILGNPEICGDDIKVSILNCIKDISHERLASLNGLRIEDSKRKLMLIGAGALGSHLLNNFIRMGFGKWTITDNDHLLPHNLTRHILPGNYISWYKADAIHHFLSNLYPSDNSIVSFHQDFLKASDNSNKLWQAAQNVDVIIDASASLSVARKLGADTPCKRAISVFFTHSGLDSVLMVEDTHRKFRLDALEIQYYRWVLQSNFGKNHLATPKNKIRYGGGCRDVSSQISIENVFLHSSLIGKQIREVLNKHSAEIIINKTDDHHNTNFISLTPTPIKRKFSNGWEILYDQYILDKLNDLRATYLPNETGGSLIGFFDDLRKRIYIVDALPPPPDSKHSPTSFVRGSKGQKQTLEKISKRTQGQVVFVGDWHSHPKGASVRPSKYDKELLKNYASGMGNEGRPGLILILGDKNKLNWLVKEDV